MKTIHDFELPKNLAPSLAKAKKLEWITLFYLISVTILMYLVMGQSQAMKSAWLEDLLSLVPCIAFLIATRVNTKKPNARFPYGYHRVFSISFLTGALALFGMGIFLVFDSSMALFKAEHPTIGTREFFGKNIWMGWVMILVLIYSSLPAVVLGFKKLPIAKKLHNKILLTDAQAQKADYMTSFAAIVGILGVGAGFWWADAVAAIFISFSVLKDGFTNLKNAILDLMDRHPVTIEGHKNDPVIEEVEGLVKNQSWVKDAKVRFRENGQVYFGEIAVIPNQISLEKIEDTSALIRKKHWKLHDFTIALVEELPDW
ncbi:cation diffusion facilitator family transporter [Salegentibacter sp. F14]